MKKLYLFLVFLLLVAQAFSQPEKGFVYLKNGTILKGKYLYTEDLSKLKVHSAGNLWIFDAGEVDHVSTKKSQLLNEFAEQNFKSDFLFRTELGLLVGNSENSQSAPFSFSTTLNYNLMPRLAVGAGVGLEFLKETYLPAVANVEYKFRNSYSTPYIFVKAGYMIPLEEANPVYNNGIQPTYYYDIMPWPVPDDMYKKQDAVGGFIVNPGIAFQRMYSSGFGMSLAFGYQFHRLRYKAENDYQLNIDYNRLSIKLGFIFN
jgi:hypothetical protein